MGRKPAERVPTGVVARNTIGYESHVPCGMCGIGVVAFLTLLRFAGPRGPDATVEAARAALLFVQETLGGLALGAVTGVVAFVLIKGGYTLAEALHVSAPLATVVAGLLIGNHGRAFAMSDATRERLDVFWEVIDEILKAVLFVLVGLQLLTVEVTRQVLAAGAAAVVVTVLARWVSTGIPLTLLRRYARVATPSVGLMTWAGDPPGRPAAPRVESELPS